MEVKSISNRHHILYQVRPSICGTKNVHQRKKRLFMKTICFLIFNLCLFGLLTACGSGKKRNSYDSGNFKDGDCGITVVSDYNTVVARCRYTIMGTADDVKSCKKTALSFLQKYPGINCTAEEISNSSVDNKKITLTSAKIKKIVGELTALGY